MAARSGPGDAASASADGRSFDDDDDLTATAYLRSRVDSLLALRTDAPKFLAALDAVAVFYGENPPPPPEGPGPPPPAEEDEEEGGEGEGAVRKKVPGTANGTAQDVAAQEQAALEAAAAIAEREEKAAAYAAAWQMKTAEATAGVAALAAATAAAFPDDAGAQKTAEKAAAAAKAAADDARETRPRAETERQEMLDDLTKDWVPRPGHDGGYVEDELRERIEGHSLFLAQQVLKSLQPIADQLENMDTACKVLQATCTEVEEKLEAVRKPTLAYLETERSMIQEREQLERRAKLVESFLVETRLSEAETTALATADLAVEGEAAAFFASLEHLQRIRSSESSLSTGWARAAGLELIERTSTLQSMAYERLFKWVRANCEAVGNGASGASGAARGGGGSSARPASAARTIKRGLRLLRDRPAYFEECCAAIVSHTRDTLRRRFVVALTQGGTGPDGASPPIEMHSHSSFRFVGDMLAWVHSTMASESDLLCSLFGKNAEQEEAEETREQERREREAEQEAEYDGDSLEQQQQEEEKEVAPPRVAARPSAGQFQRVEHLIPTAFEGMLRPLKVRVNQAVRGEQSVTVCFQLCDLLCLYDEMITKAALLPPQCVFMQGFRATLAKTRGKFNDLIKAESSKLMHSTTIYPSDLSVSQPVRGAVGVVAQLCEVFSGSVVARGGAGDSGDAAGGPDAENPAADLRGDVQGAIRTLVEAVKFVCQASASGLEAIDRGVYVVNNMTFLAGAMAPHAAVVKQWTESLTAEADVWVEAVVSDLAKDVLRGCGLLEVLAAARNAGQGDPPALMAGMPGMDAAALSPRLSAFSAQLFLLHGVRELRLLASPAVRERCRVAVARVLGAAYAAVHAAVHGPGGGYGAEAAAQLLPYEPGQMYTVLDAAGDAAA